MHTYTNLGTAIMRLVMHAFVLFCAIICVSGCSALGGTDESRPTIEAELTDLVDEATRLAATQASSGTQTVATAAAAATYVAGLEGINRGLSVTLRAAVPPTQQVVLNNAPVTPGMNEPMAGFLMEQMVATEGGEQFAGTISASNSAVRIDATFAAGETAFIAAVATSGDLDTVLTIYDRVGNVLAQNDDFNFQESLNSGLSFTAPNSGVYILEVSRFQGAAGTTSGSFVLSISRGRTDAPTLAVQAPPQGGAPQPPATGSDGSQNQFTQIATAAGVRDTDGCASSYTTSFSVGASRIYATTRVFNIRAGTNVYVQWSFDGQVVSTSETYTVPQDDPDFCLWFYLEPADAPFQPGNWSAQYYANGVAQNPPAAFTMN